MNAFFTLILVVFVADVNSQKQYCSLKSCGGKVHTMCIYTNPNPALACGSSRQAGLTTKERDDIVNLHNKYRQLVASGQEKRGATGPQPAAKIMPNLVWDPEIASIAQRWANQCNYGHDKCRDVARFPIGQNVGMSSAWGTNANYPDIIELVKAWYNEVVDFDGSTVGSFRGVGSVQNAKQIGHYTQLVWGKTTRIGCGAVRYKDGEKFNTYLVCDYGETGNYINAPVYERK